LTEPRSAALRRFLDSLDAPLGPRTFDQLDLAALEQLRGPERDEAIDAMLERLERRPNGRLADALVVAGATRAVEPLRRSLAREMGAATRVAVARALAQLAGPGDEVAVVCDVLAHSPQWSERAMAASALRHFPGATAEEALWEGLSDADPVVRFNAFDALLARHDQGEHAGDYLTLLGQLRLLIGHEHSALRRLGQAELRALLDATDAGASAHSRHLTFEAPEEAPYVQQLVERLGERDATLELPAAATLSDAEHDWLALALLSGLGRDERVPELLSRLRPAEVVPRLEALLAEPDVPQRQSLQDALAALTASRGEGE
jgi:hypothetical protein